jgi:hypothetical protein
MKKFIISFCIAIALGLVYYFYQQPSLTANVAVQNASDIPIHKLETTPPVGEPKNPYEAQLVKCYVEINLFCKDADPPYKGIDGCLLDHFEKLGPLCIETLQGQLELFKICTLDIAKFCPDVKMWRGRIPACLKKHSKSLSKECKNRLGSRN